MIGIIDYGMGNTASIANMIRKAGGESIIATERADLERAETLILPGVGAFDNAVSRLRERGWIEILLDHVAASKKLVGICLGMQLLFQSSQEGALPGLGLIEGNVQRFVFGPESVPTLKIPHMGWNTVDFARSHFLSAGYSEKPRFYFVHSFHAVCTNDSDIVATADYGYPFSCVVERENVLGVQFHPEKSHAFGLQLFKNLLDR